MNSRLVSRQNEGATQHTWYVVAQSNRHVCREVVGGEVLLVICLSAVVPESQSRSHVFLVTKVWYVLILLFYQ